ncbi:MAG TPA: MoxR family ATPase [Phycisphaerales bacterium]|nr:MoxR family ATPase [Phycisphaerales bacterium]
MSEIKPEELQRISEAHDRLRAEIGKIIVGQEDVIEEMLVCIFSRGHALVVGVPGLAKTLLISTIARTLSLDFSRIQFTPDLMPSDITGTEVFQEDKTTGQRSLCFIHGPIFANVILADEINRTPPKTQAALLEAMQEGQVTAGGQMHSLPSPFFVLATQNPIEQEGTYALPEAQLDRFMYQIRIGYPSAEEELEIVRRSSFKGEVEINPVLSAGEILSMQQLVRHAPVADHVIRYALRLVRATRQPGEGEEDHRPQVVKDYVGWGAGPRASENLILAAKASAILSGSTHADIGHVQRAALPVLRHRVLTNFNAEADQIKPDDVIRRLIEAVPVEDESPESLKEVDRLMG